MTPFPWKEAMAFGFGVMRLPPQQFWAMTPLELAYAIEAIHGRSSPLDRETFSELMRKFPDEL